MSSAGEALREWRDCQWEINGPGYRSNLPSNMILNRAVHAAHVAQIFIINSLRSYRYGVKLTHLLTSHIHKFHLLHFARG